MLSLIALNDVSNSRVRFGLVAAIVGVDHMRPITCNDGRETLLTTLYLQDGTSQQDAELSLWDNDCLRASTLRILDLVHVTEACTMPPKPHLNPKHDTYVANSCNVRIALKGPTAAVRLIGESAASEPCDTLSRAAHNVKIWRDNRYQPLMSMRRRGAIWTHDSPGHVAHRQRPSISNSGVHFPGIGSAIAAENTRHNDFRQRHIYATGASVWDPQQRREQKLIRLDDVRCGKHSEPVEVSSVRVTHAFVKARGTPLFLIPNGHQGTARALQAGCTYSCVICGRRGDNREAIENDRDLIEHCRKCGGNLSWTFGPIMLALVDDSCETLALVSGMDVSHLLMGVQPTLLRRNRCVADWCAATLHALVLDPGPFTAVVSTPEQDKDALRADVLLRRLLVQ